MDEAARRCVPDVCRSLVACERPDHLTESHVSERCLGTQPGEWNYNYIQPKGTTAIGRKWHRFFLGGVTATKGDTAGKLEELSSDCHIVNEN